MICFFEGSHLPHENFTQRVENVIACGTNNDFLGSCKFPGVNIYSAVLRFSKLKTEIDDIFSSSSVKGWLTAYNVEKKYSNRLLVSCIRYF